MKDTHQDSQGEVWQRQGHRIWLQGLPAVEPLALHKRLLDDELAKHRRQRSRKSSSRAPYFKGSGKDKGEDFPAGKGKHTAKGEQGR